VEEIESVTILVFGSHPEITRYVTRSLKRAGYRVLPSLTREDTLRHIEESSVDAMVLGGPTAHDAADEVIAALKGRWPWAPVLYPTSPDDVLELVKRQFTEDVT
jgi:DNA-binding NtrC family response regulator